MQLIENNAYASLAFCSWFYVSFNNSKQVDRIIEQ